MMFPRLLAIAEKGWSAEGSSTWEEFKTRLGGQLKSLQERGINAYDLHDAPEVTTEGKKIFIESENPSAVVRYTLDGSDPSSDSDLYKGPLTIKGNKVTVKAAAFVGDKRASYVKVTNVVRGEIVKEYYPYICADR
jgi:hexosaminidase